MGPEAIPTWARKMVNPNFLVTRFAENGIVQMKGPEQRSFPNQQGEQEQRCEAECHLPAARERQRNHPQQQAQRGTDADRR